MTSGARVTGVKTFFTKLHRNQERLQLFADLSDPINNVVIQNQSSAVWDQVRYFVITPDENMEGVVRQALAGLGIPKEHVFTEQIPSMLGETNMTIGLGEESDDFLTVLRYAMPVDTIRANSWLQRLPMVVLRIRDTRPDHGPQPYPWIEFEDRSGTEPPETNRLAAARGGRWSTVVGEWCGCPDAGWPITRRGVSDGQAQCGSRSWR